MDSKLKSEKLTINVGVMELGKIDLLVDNMMYSNRSDFCRIAIRELLEKHSNDYENLYNQSKQVQFDNNIRTIGGIGVIRLSKSVLQESFHNLTKVNVMVTGLLIVDRDISVELFESTIKKIKVYGKIRASKTIIEVIKKKEDSDYTS